MNVGSVNCMLIPPSDLISQSDVFTNRYVAYPGADRFVEAFTAEHVCQSLSLRRHGGGAMRTPLSLHVHIPFCESQCYYCISSHVVTPQRAQGATYLAYLRRELELKLAELGAGQVISHLCLGGGSPTFLQDDELTALVELLRSQFTFEADATLHIDVDPRAVDETRLRHLAALGFKHLKLGVQDFDPSVQEAVNRYQSSEGVDRLLDAARRLSLTSVEVDLVYGLPRQNGLTFEKTLAQLCQWLPDRVSLHAYTHLPTRFKSHRKIKASELPLAADTSLMRVRAQMALQEAGYLHLGMDCFALPQDALAVAKRQGRLHRGLQGYSAQSDGDLLGLGPSAISKLGGTYSQNASSIETYYDFLDQDCLPVVKGLALSRDDLLRRAAIMALLCQGQIDFESIELSWLIDFKRYFASELEALEPMKAQGLVEIGRTFIQITPVGCFFAPELARVFDRYHQADHARSRLSRII